MKKRAKEGMLGSIPRLLLSLFLIPFVTVIYAQQVTGTVSDESGKRLSGVTVTAKGTTRAVVTDNTGKFTINASRNDALIFTSVGFTRQEVAINGRQSIDVTMAADVRNMEDVVVTALGIKRESRRLGYSATTAKVDEMQKSRTNNVMASLEGKVAGLDIAPPSAGPASSTKIRIRGQSGFSGAENGPLIVINGLPMSQGANSANGGGGADPGSRDEGDALLQINPDDIESMTVLKGATAAALYGSRASNGAIIVTTKTGTRNAGIGVEYTSNVTVDQVLDLTHFQNEFGQGGGSINPAGPVNPVTGQIIQTGTRPGIRGTSPVATGQLGWGERYDDVPTIQFDGVLRPYSAPSGSRIKEFYNTGVTTTNSIAVSSGGQRGSFRASFSNMDAKGITPGNTYNRKIFNLGVDQKLSDRLSVNINLNYTNDQNINPPQGGVQGQNYMNFLVRTSPVVPLSAYKEHQVDANGAELPTNGFGTTVLNPYFYIDREFFRDRNDRLLGTVSARYQILKWLYLQGRVNMNYSSTGQQYNNPTGGGGFGTGFNQIYTDATSSYFNGSYNTSQNQNRDMNYDFILGGNHKFGDFSIDAFFSGNRRNTLNRGINANSSAFVTRGIYTIGNGSTFTQGELYSHTQTNSLFGSAELGWKNYLFLTVTGRDDWFSVLMPGHDSYFYPSVSGSFIFTEITKDKYKWLNYGKLRASWANVGQLSGVGFAGFDVPYSYSTNKYLNRTVGNISGTIPNPLLKPYSLQEQEIGLELRMFGSRVNVDMAVYHKKTTDQIMPVQVSAASGTGSINQNIASLENRGAEFLLDVTPVRSHDFTWNSSFNTAYNISKVLDMGGLSRFLVTDFYNGGGSNEFMGKQVYQVGLPLAQLAANTYKRDPKTGEVLLTGTGQLIPNGVDVLFGSALPTFTGGWNNTFSYKKLSLLVQFDYKAGGKVISGTALNALRQGFSQASLVGRGPGEIGVVFPGIIDATYPNAGQPNTNPVFGQTFYADYRTKQIADPFVYKSDYIKLRNITLSYDLSRWIGTKVQFVKGLSLALSCRNVAILKKFIPDVDPEQLASSGDARAGYEAVALPTTRSWGLNLNVKF